MMNWGCEMVGEELESLIPGIKGSDCVHDIVESVTNHVNKLNTEIIELKREISLLKAKAHYNIIKIN